MDPPPLSQRPVFPYKPGRTLVAYYREAGDPFGDNYGPWRDRPNSSDYFSDSTQLEYCITMSKLLYGDKIPEERLNLQIEEKLSDTAHGANVVLVRSGAVAKIYDPLYYNPFDIFGRQQDVVSCAEEHFRTEVAAYHKLNGTGSRAYAARQYVPAFHGCGVLVVPTPTSTGDVNRLVPFVHIEHVDGRVMGYAEEWPEHLRKVILRNIFKVEPVIHHAGVTHGDISPRNIIVAENGDVRIIDFASAYVHGYGDRARDIENAENKIRRGEHDQMIHPAVRLWDNMDDFVDNGWFKTEADAKRCLRGLSNTLFALEEPDDWDDFAPNRRQSKQKALGVEKRGSRGVRTLLRRFRGRDTSEATRDKVSIFDP